MISECFLFSSEIINCKPCSNNIYIYSKDAKVFICKKIPHLAYFQIPYHINPKWVFYANDIPITVINSNSISVPFYKLQNLLNKPNGNENNSIYATNQEISYSLTNLPDLLFQNNEINVNDDDIVIFFKLISKNFPFNHFSSKYNKLHHQTICIKSNLIDIEHKIEISLKHFLLSVRPNGRPNPEPLFEFTKSFLIFFPQLIYSSYYQTHRKFVLTGIHYILDYMHNDCEWGPYSVLSFLLFYFVNGQIQTHPINNYDIEQNPDFFFDKKNLECIEHCSASFGKLSLVWCYNPCFHNEFIKLAKNFCANNCKKINQKDLINIILCRICNENANDSLDANVNDYISFFKFIQVISPENDKTVLFNELFKICASDKSESSRFIPYSFKIFCEDEIKGQTTKPPEKVHWFSALDEEEKIKLNQSLKDVYSDDDNDSRPFSSEINDLKIHKNDYVLHQSDTFETNDSHENSNDKDHFTSSKNLNFHYFNLTNEQSLVPDCFDNWNMMKKRFNQNEVKFINIPEKEADKPILPFRLTQTPDINILVNEDQNKNKKSSSSNQNIIEIQQLTTSKDGSFPTI